METTKTKKETSLGKVERKANTNGPFINYIMQLKKVGFPCCPRGIRFRIWRHYAGGLKIPNMVLRNLRTAPKRDVTDIGLQIGRDSRIQPDNEMARISF